MTARMQHTVHIAVALHVAVVVSFLVAVAADGGFRTLCALGGGVLATVAWVGWTRSAVLHAEMRQPRPPRPVMNGSVVSLSAARPDPVIPSYAPTGT